MTEDERTALLVIQAGMELLRNAIIKGDPPRELDLRARDLLADIRAVADGKARMVANFEHT